MKQNQWFVLGVAWVAIWVPAMADAQQQQLDSVVGQLGIATFGSIESMTRDQLTISARGAKKVFKTNEIQKLTFAGEPSELRRARDMIGRDQLEDARTELNKISPAGITRTEILQEIEFYKAYCAGRLALSRGGDKASAVRAMRAFIEKPGNDNSIHYYAASELLGELAVALAKYDAAIKYFGKLAKAPWPEYQTRASVLIGRAMMANGQFQEALGEFEKVLASGRDDAKSRELKQMALVGKATCLGETGKADDGIKILDKILAENDSRTNAKLFALAYNALGTCYLRLDKPKDALLAYLHVDLLFFQDADAHAESLYHLSRLWRKLNRAERALQARSLLKSRYGGSMWAKRE